MKLNPVYNFIKKTNTFTFMDVMKACKDDVIDPYYIRQAFFYLASSATIKRVKDPMPDKVIVGEKIVKWDIGETLEETFKNEPVREPVYGYSVYKWDEKPDFHMMGKFHKTDEWKKEFGRMKNPFLTRPFGHLVDLDSTKFKDEFFTNHKTYNDKKPREKWSDLDWKEIAIRTREEISRGLYYIAVHNFDRADHGFPLRPHDREHQWQRVVDIGLEYQMLWYRCFDKKCKWTPERKAFEMFKMHWIISSETENMC